MNTARWIAIISLLATAAVLSSGCEAKPKMYGRESNLSLGGQPRVWAVAPVINLSGQSGVDALLQADILYQQLQTVSGLTIVPVDRVAQVYAAAGIEQVQSVDQANLVMDQLGCDGLIVASITQFDPYNPPKFGGALQLFEKPQNRGPQVGDPRDLLRAGSAPEAGQALPGHPDFQQVVGMFDAANGSVRDAVISYAGGRHEPEGPMGATEYFSSMDRFCGFAYYSLLDSLLVQLRTANGR